MSAIVVILSMENKIQKWNTKRLISLFCLGKDTKRALSVSSSITTPLKVTLNTQKKISYSHSLQWVTRRQKSLRTVFKDMHLIEFSSLLENVAGMSGYYSKWTTILFKIIMNSKAAKYRQINISTASIWTDTSLSIILNSLDFLLSHRHLSKVFR